MEASAKSNPKRFTLDLGGKSNSGRFDFIILPYKFSDNSSDCGTRKALRRSLAGATKSEVLFCP
jgi:hypothetical protein